VTYLPASDTIVMITLLQGSSFTQEVYVAPNSGTIQSHSGHPVGTNSAFLENGPPYGNVIPAPPAFSGSIASGNLEFLTSQFFSTTSYEYNIYYSTKVPSGGSLLAQFLPWPETIASGQPKTSWLFPNDPFSRFVGADETTGVVFISTNNGNMKKYKYTDLGSVNAMNITTSYYNSDTLVDSSNPAFSYQAFSKNHQVIYLASQTSQGIWRVPFYTCGTATTCTSCVALNDPYCGWCPLSATCTPNTLAACSTNSSVNGWLQSGCPSATLSVSPNPVAATAQPSVTITASNLIDNGSKLSHFFLLTSSFNKYHFLASRDWICLQLHPPRRCRADRDCDKEFKHFHLHAPHHFIPTLRHLGGKHHHSRLLWWQCHRVPGWHHHSL